MEIVSITHASDIDGIGSAALIRRKMGVRLDRVFFSDYSEEALAGISDDVGRISSREETLLFLTDLGMNRGLAGIYKEIINNAQSNGGMAVWLDHHYWEPRLIKEVAGLCDFAVVGENRRYCATEITMRFLGVRDTFARKLAGIVHYSDFNIRPKDENTRKTVGNYALGIAGFNNAGEERKIGMLRRLVGTISEGRLSSSELESSAARFRRMSEARIRKMLGGLCRVGSDAYIGFSKSIQSTQGCGAILEAKGCELGIYVNTDSGKAHLRSKGAVDCAKLAGMFGGGGHPRAAGFQIDMRTFRIGSKEGREKLGREIEKCISK